MVFSGITFLYAFLPLTLVLYYLAPRKAKNAVLLAASLVFYAFGEPVYVLLLVLSSLSDYLHSLYIEKHRGTRAAKRALVSSIVLNVGLLGFFKYADFLLGTVNGIFGTALPLLHVPLPIGISFFTFQTMSYTIDVYRGRVHAQKNLLTLATFVCLFPQLIAGPIVRYSDLAPELAQRKHSLDGIAAGIGRFTVGLGKKVLLANTLGELCAAFSASSEQSVLFAWLYAIGFTLQIYYDFSGYSDMAIGLGAMLGLSFPENFDYPYRARSVTEFWRRWHMTLGSWFRDYVYIPLGGNRTKQKWKWLRNIAVVWLLTGLWHGAAWNFVLWGVFFGLLLMAEKLWLAKWLEKLPPLLRHGYLLLAVVFSFVLFNAASVTEALEVMGRMLGGTSAVGVQAVYALRSYGVVLALAAFGASGIPRRLFERVRGRRWMAVVQPVALGVLLLVCTAYLVDSSFNPFLYFRF